MVPMSEKRHRIYEDEFEQVFRGLLLRLKQLLETEEDQESAEVVLRVLTRFLSLKRGRPKYFEFTWSDARTLYEMYGGETSENSPTTEEASEKG